jgi:hypothetical protein
VQESFTFPGQSSKTCNPLAGGAVASASGSFEGRFNPDAVAFAFLWIYPAFFSCIWVWLYAGSGFALKMLRRAGGIIEWLALKLDIENKPFAVARFGSRGGYRVRLLERVYLESFVLVLNTQRYQRSYYVGNAHQLRSDLACADRKRFEPYISPRVVAKD